MISPSTATVLFLCTGNYYRSRFAEHLFNETAARRGLAWRAESRGLAIELGVHNVGPISTATVRTLEALGVRPGGEHRLPLQVTEHDLLSADHIVAVKAAEHRPLCRERFPAWTERIEYWHVHDLDCAGPDEALAELHREVLALADRLQAGPRRRRPACTSRKSEFRKLEH